MSVTTEQPQSVKLCPCLGERSPSWHYSREIPLCETARATKNRNAQDFRNKTRKPKVIIVPDKDCPCGGEEIESWHRYRKIPVCHSARERRNQQDREAAERRRTLGTAKQWIPGTDIVIPEIDPL